MYRIAALAFLLGFAGCSTNVVDVDTILDGARGVDAPTDCHAVCITSLSSPCECMLPCHGQLTVATCAAGQCQCTLDGASTYAYAYTTCDVQPFLDGCSGVVPPDAGVDAGPDADTDAGTDAALVTPPSYTSETRMLTSSGLVRPFVIALPTDAASRSGMPLFISLHGDGGSGASMRSALPLESFSPAGGAVYVYPDAPGGSFEYWTYDGRTREAQFVRDVIDALHTELAIDTTRVFITGFSGGATMANALGCRLGPSVVRGLGLHSGTLYSTDDATGNPEFTYTGSGGVSCALPDALFVWGENDATSGVSFAEGQGVRDNYLATASCASTTTSAPITPCLTYDGCTHGVAWCPIPGMGHAIWSNAAQAMTAFFATLP